MSAEMGRLSGEMRGTVVSGAEIEAVLAMLPEQLWQWDEDVPSGVTTSSTVVVAVTVPMKVRREIVACVLAVAGAMGDG